MKAPNMSGYITSNGYREFNLPEDKKTEHVMVAEAALGHVLPVGAVVHHIDEDKLNNEPSNLVICPDQRYHVLLHQRMRALEVCGHADWLKCAHCKQYDDPKNMYVREARHQAYHRECHAAYKREKRTGGNYAQVY